ncbi:MAG TPA: dihydrofolate reductase family protein [Candidatus Nanoarchaeia archaeon]|nr:dihydrofolate reductase family protein [Candidatus Nanoarchaeia archaeon]
MRKIKLFIACSLDGFIARVDGGIDWLFTGDYGYKEFYDSIDTVLMGRKTYELALKLGETYKDKKAVVFTTKENLKKSSNIEFISDVISFTKKLKNLKGKDIWLVGGGEIVSLLLNNNLIDEMIIFMHPIILGKGIPLFKSIKKEIKLKLIGTHKFEDGLVKLYYKKLKY